MGSPQSKESNEKAWYSISNAFTKQFGGVFLPNNHANAQTVDWGTDDPAYNTNHSQFHLMQTLPAWSYVFTPTLARFDWNYIIFMESYEFDFADKKVQQSYDSVVVNLHKSFQIWRTYTENLSKEYLTYTAARVNDLRVPTSFPEWLAQQAPPPEDIVTLPALVKQAADIVLNNELNPGLGAIIKDAIQVYQSSSVVNVGTEDKPNPAPIFQVTPEPADVIGSWKAGNKNPFSFDMDFKNSEPVGPFSESPNLAYYSYALISGETVIETPFGYPECTVKVEFDGVQSFVVTRPWYNAGAMIFVGQPFPILGPQGLFGNVPTSVVLGYKPKVTITMKNEPVFDKNAEIQFIFGPFVFAESELHYDGASKTLTATSASPLPYVIGLHVDTGKYTPPQPATTTHPRHEASTGHPSHQASTSHPSQQASTTHPHQQASTL